MELMLRASKLLLRMTFYLNKNRYDVESESFWLNSMSERAMKFWIGGASEHANMAVVMANLVVSGKDYGPHAFVVQIRDDSNHRLNAGIVIGDCGPKYGYEAIGKFFI